jgi:hypothetical protein
VAEQAALSGKEFWLDNIKLIRGESPLVGNREIQIESEVNVYPNPASEKVKISFYAASPGKLEITIHDLSGRIIKTLYNGDCSAGVQQLIWNLNNEKVLVQNGIYFCRIRFDNQEITRKISVAK